VSLAYSTDNDMTYKLLGEINPVVIHKGRDPKILWHEQSQSWIIVTYRAGENVKGKGIVGGKMAFYSSKDLKKWKFESFSDAIYHECPEFVELPVDGDQNNKKWLLFDATPKYQIGSFDGKNFSADFTGTLQTMGGNIKAGQCFSNAPDGRAICMVWARTLQRDRHTPFNQGFTLPIELSLKTTSTGVRCYTAPVKELDALRQKVIFAVNDKKIAAGETIIKLEQAQRLLEIDMELETKNIPEKGPIEIIIGSTVIQYIPSSKSFPKHKLNSTDNDDGQLNLRIYIDTATIEVFAENGAVYYLENRQDQGADIKEVMYLRQSRRLEKVNRSKRIIILS
jgi:fructan beta-fructosidase